MLRRAILFAVLLLGCTTRFDLAPARTPDASADAPALDAPAFDAPALDAPALDAAFDAPLDAPVDAPGCGAAVSHCCSTPGGGDPSCAPGLVCSQGGCVACPAMLAACGNSCINLATSALHCGMCGQRCADGEVCSGGTCMLTCPPGLTACGGRCVSLASDVNHCGACGAACSANGGAARCVSGACAVACAEGRADCNGGGDGCEVDTLTDASHCGGCGARCALARATARCAMGACAVAECNAGYGDCDGNPANGCETDLAVSPTHCSACGRACAAGQECAAGLCRDATIMCGPGQGNCDGLAPNRCEVNLDTDLMHCGACGRACTVSQGTGVCRAGVCAVGSCAAPYRDCNDSALDGCEVDTRTALAHCGGCGQACARANATAQCANGACALASCNPGYGDCDRNPGNGCETNVTADADHCGGCGARCNLPNATARCDGGACAVASCANHFADCDGNPANGCEVDLRSDLASCGRCGGTCAFFNAAATCADGECRLGACAAGWGNCDGNDSNGCETDLRTSAAHCGACGAVCARPNGVTTCAAGTCALTGCAEGWGNCDASAANGCEARFASDNANCGGCGIACGTGQLCANGACALACPTGTLGCAGQCVDPQTSPENCGGCGRRCASGPNSAATCTGGVCGLRCDGGWRDCDGNAGNGCERNVLYNPDQCGACGNVCPERANATRLCSNGACAFACAAGFNDCDGNPANGCEVDLRSNLAHCGQCGRACPMVGSSHVSRSVCSSSRCEISCDAEWADCDGNAQNGCEVSLLDPLHCGACSLRCAGSTADRDGGTGFACCHPARSTTYTCCPIMCPSPSGPISNGCTPPL